MLKRYDKYDTILMPLHIADPGYLSFEKLVLPVAVERGMGIHIAGHDEQTALPGRAPRGPRAGGLEAQHGAGGGAMYLRGRLANGS